MQHIRDVVEALVRHVPGYEHQDVNPELRLRRFEKAYPFTGVGVYNLF